MKFQQAEQFLLSLSNIPRKEYMDDPHKTSAYIEKIQFFLNLIGNPEKKIPHYIHVTGTSGKGSVSTFMASILHAHGKKVGLTISPHPTIILERWQVNGKNMTKKEFVDIITFLKPKLDVYMRTSPYDMLSFFDLTTIIALMYFAQKKVDWAVVEVGCGGRLDSTNVIPRKDVAVITNIGLDHMEILGNTKEKIAFEKAGIIKPGCDVFTMETNPKVLRVIQKQCEKQKVKLHTQYPLLVGEGKGEVRVNEMYSVLPPNLTPNPSPTRRGTVVATNQTQNILLCKKIAGHLKISQKATEQGIKKAKQPLRMEIISHKPFIILDGAHNEDKIRSTTEATKHILSTRKQKTNLHLMLGFSADKDIPKLIQILSVLKPKTIACTRQTANSFRKAAHPKQLQDMCKQHMATAKTEIFIDPQDAFAWSKKNTKSNDILLVTGSIFLSGEVKGFFHQV